MSDDSPIAYVRDDGAVAIRASASGMCGRALWAVLDGIEPTADPEYLTRAAEEGNIHEPHVREKISEQLGRKVYGDQETLELWIIPKKLVIVGHCDGFVEAEEGTGLAPDLLEVKTMSRNVFDRWMAGGFESQPKYAWQISSYLLAAGWRDDEVLGAVYAAKRRDDGLIDVRYIEEPPVSFKEIRSKMLKVYRAWKLDEMPDCDLPPKQRYPCPVFFLHDEEIGEDDEHEVEEAPDLDALAAEYVELSETEKYAKKRKKDIKAQIEAEYRNGRDVFGTEHYRIKVQHVDRESLDKAALVSEKGEDFIKPYLKDSGYDRWDIKRLRTKE